jgi:hypothetical protein
MPRSSPPAEAPRAPAAPVTPPAFPPVDDDPFAPAPARDKKPTTAPAQPAPAAPAAPANDDPFAPAPGATSVPKSAEPDSDDPFAPAPPARSERNSRPQSTAPTALTPADKLADLVPLDAQGRLAIREWADSTGHFRVKGRLVLLLEGKVRLLKETGRTTTVPVERLSAADRAYVAEVVARYGSDLELLDQLAAR